MVGHGKMLERQQDARVRGPSAHISHRTMSNDSATDNDFDSIASPDWTPDADSPDRLGPIIECHQRGQQVGLKRPNHDGQWIVADAGSVVQVGEME